MDGIQQIFAQGGWVSYALTLVSVLLWSSVVMRSLMLRGASSLDLNTTQTGASILSKFIRQAQSLRTQPQRLEKLAQRTLHELGFMRSFIRTLVAVAPLLGLLGTVIGMVEMFGSMHLSVDDGTQPTHEYPSYYSLSEVAQLHARIICSHLTLPFMCTCELLFSSSSRFSLKYS